jgi:hypothetical protein
MTQKDSGTDWPLVAVEEAVRGWRTEVVKAGKAAGRLVEDLALEMAAQDFSIHDTERAGRLLREALGRILYADLSRCAAVSYRVGAGEVRAQVRTVTSAASEQPIERVQVLRRFYAAGMRYVLRDHGLYMVEYRLVH